MLQVPNIETHPLCFSRGGSLSSYGKIHIVEVIYGVYIYIYMYIYMVPPKKHTQRCCLKTLVIAVFSDKNLHLPEHSFFKPFSATAEASHLPNPAHTATKHYACIRASLQGSSLETEKLRNKQLEKTEKPRIWRDMAGGGGAALMSLRILGFQFFTVFFQFFSVFFSFFQLFFSFFQFFKFYFSVFPIFPRFPWHLSRTKSIFLKPSGSSDSLLLFCPLF